EDAQASRGVPEKEQTSTARGRLVHTGPRERGRGLVEAPLLDQRVGGKGGGSREEASRRTPLARGGQRTPGVCSGAGEVAPPQERLRAEDLDRGEGEGRAALVCLGECVLVDRKHFVEVRHRQHRGGGADRTEDVRSDQRSFAGGGAA